jgi:hypothetical protein
VALGVIPSDAGLLCLQAGLVAAPRAINPTVSDVLKRFRGPGWALIPIVSIVGVIFAIKFASSTANVLTWLALIACPLLSIAALGWLIHGARWWFALLVPVLFLLAWRTPYSLWGEGAAALLSGISCVTLGVLLAAVTPAGWLKLGVLAMACADVYLVSTNTLQAPNNTLSAAVPASGLPQLQSELWGSVTLGYGDVFVAGVLGAVWASRPRPQVCAALATITIAALFDHLFRHDFDTIGLPATVPVALSLIGMEVWDGGRRWTRGEPVFDVEHRTRRARARAAGLLSARRGLSRPAGETPPPGS